MAHLDKEAVRKKTLALYVRRAAFAVAYVQSTCHRNSHAVDRLLRRLDYPMHCMQNHHSMTEAAE